MGSMRKNSEDDSLIAIDIEKIQQTVLNWGYVIKHALQYYYRLNPTFIKVSLICYGLTFLIILPVICYGLPYSVYWKKWDNRDIVKQVSVSNHERFVEASNSIRTMKPWGIVLNPELTIGVITVKRTMGNRPIGYLTQVMAKLNHLTLLEHPFKSIQLVICDVHAGPGPHTEADVLQQVFERKQRFREADAAAVIMDSFEKEKQDYVFCLQQSLERKPRYVLMLEDDALPRNELLDVIHSQLTVIKESKQQWSLMKLYYPEKWQGYSFEMASVLELLSVGVLSGFAFFAVQYKYSRHPLARINKWLKRAAFFIGFCYGILLCLAVGRSHLLELKRLSTYTYSLRHAPDCCSPGILYPADSVAKLIEVLNSTQCNHNYPLDMALAMFTQNLGHRTYIIEPNLVQHIGMVSTIKGVSNSPWDFML